MGWLKRRRGRDGQMLFYALYRDLQGRTPNDWFRVNVWDPAMKQADLGFHMTPHGMRHAHASWLLAGDADLQVVKERLGHGSITTTERYLHTLPGHHDAALAALANIRGDRDGAESPASEPDPVNRRSEPDPPGHGAEIAELKAMIARLTAVLGPRDEPA